MECIAKHHANTELKATKMIIRGCNPKKDMSIMHWQKRTKTHTIVHKIPQEHQGLSNQN